MMVGDRIRELREDKKLSQGDIEKRTGLLRAYLSRVENGHTVPSLETLERLASALEVPLYLLLYDGDEPPKAPRQLTSKTGESWFGVSGKDAIYLEKLRRSLGKLSEGDRQMIMQVAHKLARRRATAEPPRG